MPRIFRHFDWVLFGCTFFLLVWGVAMIYSAAPVQNTDPISWNDPLKAFGEITQEFFVRQIGLILLGLVGMVVLALIDYRIWELWPRLPYLLAIGLLVSVVLGGTTSFGATRALGVLQPAELAKLLVILTLAKFLASHDSEGQRWYHVLFSLILIAIPAGLVYLQPSLTNSIVMVIIGLGMLLMWGIRARYLVLLGVAAVAAVILFLATAQGYQLDRIALFIDPDTDPLGKNFNVTQARITIGSGSWTGQGYLQGSQSQLKFLRARHTDFIFSVLGEEFGFAGGVVFVLLIIVICMRMLRAAEMSRDTYGRLIIVGLTIMLFFQTAVNLSVNVGLIPVTGIPLPFMSSGGTAVVSILLGQGLVQSVLIRHRKLEFE